MKWLFFVCAHEIQEIDTDTNMNSSTNLMQGNLCAYTCLNEVVVCKLWANEEKSKLLTERNGIEWNEMNEYSLKQWKYQCHIDLYEMNSTVWKCRRERAMRCQFQPKHLLTTHVAVGYRLFWQILFSFRWLNISFFSQSRNLGGCFLHNSSPI